jgi:hypothetical protein
MDCGFKLANAGFVSRAAGIESVKQFLFLLLPALIVSGCATSTVESRRKERLAAYQALNAEERDLVDKGQIKVGMSQDAVYIAWGAPSQVLQSESGEGGVQSTWLYHSSSMEETRYWNFREMPYQGTVFLERYLEREYYPRDYVSAEIVFVNGKVARWRTLPRPTY